jgi:predicted TIM-barrel fold metal-dependent hydrolase
MKSKVIDIHVHFGGPEDPDHWTGFWSKKFQRSAAYYAMLLVTDSLFKKITLDTVKSHMLKVIEKSKKVKQVVLLAMDKVYDENGEAKDKKTHLYTPNSFIAELAKKYDKILFGASVHPYRNDWEDELNFCLENGAVVCKWICSSMQIDPRHEKCARFYRKLAEHKLPLLYHTGPEYAIPTSNDDFDEFNDPDYVKPALEAGVTVIAAHCALPYFWILDDEQYQDDFGKLVRLFDYAKEHGYELYADMSALAGPTRIPYIEELDKKLPHDKLLFGSDYPIPISPLSYQKTQNIFQRLWSITDIFSTKNSLDQNYKIIKRMGFADTFENTEPLFNRIDRSAAR